MRHYGRVILVALSTGIFCSPSAMSQGGPYEYAFFRLNTFGEPGGQGFGINDRGVAVGQTTSELFLSGSFAWLEGQSFDLRPPGMEESIARSINDRNVVVGGASVEGGRDVAGIWENGAYRELGFLGGDSSMAYGVNNSGHVVGWTDIDDVVFNGFHWFDGVMTDLGSLPEGLGSRAFDINNAGTIVGISGAGTGFWHPVAWVDGQIVELPILEGRLISYAEEINELGQIAGYAYDSAFADAVVWENGKVTSINDVSISRQSYAYGINDLGEVVGFADLSDFDFEAFIWRDGEMRLLRDLVPPHLRLIRIEGARDINNWGQIVGDLEGRNPFDRAFLASPVYPAMSLAQPIPGHSNNVNTVTISGGIPGASIYVAYGGKGGGEVILDCDLRDGVALQIQDPTVIGPFVADANGEVVITTFVPPVATDLGDILIQAFDPDNCLVSQLIVEVFE